MAHKEIKMNYGEMNEMAGIFERSAETVNQTSQAMDKIIAMLHEGALKGQPGDELSNAIGQNLKPKLKQISEKMSELRADILIAMSDLMASDQDGAKGF
jgi:WXG100 family type VII secretion target